MHIGTDKWRLEISPGITGWLLWFEGQRFNALAQRDPEANPWWGRDVIERVEPFGTAAVIEWGRRWSFGRAYLQVERRARPFGFVWNGEGPE
jgi:hypothetical protein